MTTRNYDREFKLNAVKLYRESQKPMSQISKDLEIPMSTLSGWIKEFESHGEESFPGSCKLKPCNEEVYLLKTKRDKIEFMVKNKDIFSLEKMAEVLDVARSNYYLSQRPSKRCMENQKIVEKAREVYLKSRGTYGSPRIHASLQRLGIQCSRPRVARLMKKANLQAKMVKAWKRTTKRKNEHSVEPNHLSQQFHVTEPNKVWVSDITYVKTEEGWLYVSVSLDLFSRKVVGLSMGASLETSLVVKTVDQAFTHRKRGKELMHHSDRGCQYTSKCFEGFMEEHDVKLSMSHKGCCYDNAVAESFFHTLKTEHVDFCNYRTREEAVNSIFEYIEVFYNRERLHSTLGYYTPVEYEKLWDIKQCSGF